MYSIDYKGNDGIYHILGSRHKVRAYDCVRSRHSSIFSLDRLRREEKATGISFRWFHVRRPRLGRGVHDEVIMCMPWHLIVAEIDCRASQRRAVKLNQRVEWYRPVAERMVPTRLFGGS